ALTRRKAFVLLARDEDHRRVDVLPVRVDLLEAAVEADRGADVCVARGHELRQPAAHAEADHAVRLRRTLGTRQEPGAGRGDLVRRAFGIELHHQLAGFIRRLRGLAVKQIGSTREEAFIREAVADVLDVPHQAPPFLNDDDRGTVARFWCSEVAKFVALTHGWRFYYEGVTFGGRGPYSG